MTPTEASFQVLSHSEQLFESKNHLSMAPRVSFVTSQSLDVEIRLTKQNEED